MFYCFNCGHKLIELGFGGYVCSNCKREYFPFLDKDEQQCMCNYFTGFVETMRSSSTSHNVPNTPKG